MPKFKSYATIACYAETDIDAADAATAKQIAATLTVDDYIVTSQALHQEGLYKVGKDGTESE